jgi:hypothetical protein
MSLRTMSLLNSSINIRGYAGHTHFWERLTRRQFLTTATGAFGLVLGSSAWMPKLVDVAEATSIAPKPIPGGLTAADFGVTITNSTELFHVFAPLAAPGNDPSTITDFHGFVAAAEIRGTARRVGADGATLFFDNDMRFMQGQYIGVDGELHNGTFGFF